MELAILATLGGCFADAGGGGTSQGTGGSTGPADCPTGAKGCSCTGGGACDDGLQCHGPSGLCFDAMCERGTESCECLDGACVGMLECRDELCQPPLPSGTDSTTSTAASETTIGSTMGSEATGSSSASTDGSTGPNGSPCGACVDMAGQIMCQAYYDACLADPDQGCEPALECAIAIGPTGLCCPIDQPGSTSLWNELLACTSSHCNTECDGPIPQCKGN